MASSSRVRSVGGEAPPPPKSAAAPRLPPYVVREEPWGLDGPDLAVWLGRWPEVGSYRLASLEVVKTTLGPFYRAVFELR